MERDYEFYVIYGLPRKHSGKQNGEYHIWLGTGAEEAGCAHAVT